MAIVVCGGLKGGSGKSTLATNLTVLRSQAEKNILLVDADEQKSTTEWVAQREHKGINSKWTTIQIHGISLNTQILKLKKSYDDIIIDVGGRDTTSQRSSLTVCDVLLVPFRPRSVDLWTLDNLNNLVAEIRTVNKRMKCYAVINQAESRGKDNEEAMKLISEYSEIECLPCTIGARKCFGNALSEGIAVSEIKVSVAKAVEEITSLYNHIYS